MVSLKIDRFLEIWEVSGWSQWFQLCVCACVWSVCVCMGVSVRTHAPWKVKLDWVLLGIFQMGKSEFKGRRKQRCWWEKSLSHFRRSCKCTWGEPIHGWQAIVFKSVESGCPGRVGEHERGWAEQGLETSKGVYPGWRPDDKWRATVSTCQCRQFRLGTYPEVSTPPTTE